MNHPAKATLGLFILFFLSCLKQGEPPLGTKLASGRDIEKFQFIQLGGETLLRFERRLAFAEGRLGARYDTYVVALDGSGMRKVVANRTDHGPQLWSFPTGSTQPQNLLVDERLGPNGAAVSTLLRLAPDLSEALRIEGISRYLTGSAPGFPDLILYLMPRQGESAQDLYLWDGATFRLLGIDTGSGLLSFGNSGAIYAILGEERTLSRLPSPDGAMQGIRKKVSRFMLSPDEAYAALSVTEDGKPRDLVLELATGKEIPLAKATGGQWLRFQGSYFVYSESKTDAAPGKVHLLDLPGATETLQEIPPPLVDLAMQLARPNSNEILVMDSKGHGVFVSAIDATVLRVFDGLLYAPLFSNDGANLLYIDPQAPTVVDPEIHGPLLMRSAELDSPAKLFSPPGTTTRRDFFRFTVGERGDFLYFWVHYGRGTWDLYFAFFDTGEVRLVTRSILQVTVGEHSIFGILNASQQDQTGDLVNRDLDTGAEVLFSHAVADMVVGGATETSPEGKVAYLVRGRAPSTHDGIWLSPLLAPPTPDAGVSP